MARTRRSRPPARPSRRTKRKSAASFRSRVWRFLFLSLARLAGVGILAVFAFIAWCALGLPDVAKLGVQTRSGSVAVVANDGTLAATYGSLYGNFVSFDEISHLMADAVVAIEDRRFFWHPGIDPIGLTRAVFVNLVSGRVIQGGSTLTQQLAKIVFLTPARTLERKVQETLLALWIEIRFEKEEILAIYLNRAYFGGGAYGVSAASRRYFGVSASELNLAQSAMLAGLLRAPSRLAPTGDLSAARRRAAVVLGIMERQDRISAEEADQARERPAALAGIAASGDGARHFGDWVISQIAPARSRTEDVEVAVTLDPALQAAAEQAVAAGLKEFEGAEAALVAMAPDGAVLAMVGGRSYARSQFNRAVQARRQPGSAFKVFLYMAALDAGARPSDMILDAPVTVDGWSPRNWDDEYLGRITLEEAFARSSNTAAVRLLEQTGRGRVIAMARRFGVFSPLEPDPSLALGTSEISLLEMTGALSALANGGSPVLPYGTVEIRTESEGTIWRRSPIARRPALDVETVEAMRRLLRAAVEQGTGRRARLDRAQAYGKTGTSQEGRDGWFVGFAGQLAAGVWVGRDDARAMRGVGGGGVTAWIWQNFMTSATTSRADLVHPQ